MTRREKPPVAEPPWVWGPTEVKEWILATHPSKRRRARSVRKGPEIVTRLQIVVEGSDAIRVRSALDEALGSVGLMLSASSEERGQRRIDAVIRRTLVGDRLHASLRFSPPIHVSSCQRIVERMGLQVRIHAVSVREERARLPARRG
ncbi:MAG TPA: hypothetical protein VIB49_03955 [Thermoplasmata archaeon]